MMMEKQRADLLCLGKYLLTMDNDNTVMENSGIAISGDEIIAIDSAENLRQKYPEAECLEEKHGLIMPGLINSHTHAAMSCFRGLADDLPLMQWLQEYIFPVEAQLTGDIVYQASLLSMCEMIKSGTTSFCDMYLFAKDVARAADLSGMRAWVGEVLYDFPSPSYGELENGFAYVDELFAQYENNERVTITVDPHAVYTCSPALLERLGALARERNARYVIHLSETEDEVQGCLDAYGNTPVQHLEKLGLLNERVIADHCVHVTARDIQLLAERGVKVVHCVESNMKLASGIAPVPEMIEKNVTVGLGTDGSASNNDVDMFGEMTTVAKIHKVHGMDPTLMDAKTTLLAATRKNGEVLGVADQIGSLECGKKADLIMLDLDQPHLTPLYNPFSHLVYAARGSDVMHSVINGKVVMKNRVLTTIDERAVKAEMGQIATNVRQMMA